MGDLGLSVYILVFLLIGEDWEDKVAWFTLALPHQETTGFAFICEQFLCISAGQVPMVPPGQEVQSLRLFAQWAIMYLSIYVFGYQKNATQYSLILGILLVSTTVIWVFNDVHQLVANFMCCTVKYIFRTFALRTAASYSQKSTIKLRAAAHSEGNYSAITISYWVHLLSASPTPFGGWGGLTLARCGFQ